MKPIWIFRHETWIGSGHLGDILTDKNIPHKYFDIELNDPVPEHLSDDVAALVFLGGTMSVNDPLAWIDQELALIRQAHKANRPVLGHCLGSQLISKALGGTVTAMANKEIGWHKVTREENEVARSWFDGIADQYRILLWHHDEFTLPPGASSLYRSEFCENQAFVLGNILATVAHIEVNTPTLGEWIRIYGHDIAPVGGSIQSGQEIGDDVEAKMAGMHVLTDQFYQRWFKMVYPALDFQFGAGQVSGIRG